MKQVIFYNTITKEAAAVELPESLAENFDNVVLVNNYETFSLKSTIPDDIKKLRNLEQQFEEKEFNTIYESWYHSPSSFEEIEKTYDESFKEYFNGCVEEKYPEINELEQSKKDSVCLTLKTRFLAYMFNKQSETEKLEETDESQICFGKDYANRIIALFKSLSLDDPVSICTFSDGLEKIENAMLSDKRRRAGFDSLMLGLSSAIQDIATIFISDPNKESVNIVEAFKNSVNNKDKKILKTKLEKVIKDSSDYYNNFLNGIDDAINTINRVDSNKSVAYLRVAWRIVSDFCHATDQFIKDLNQVKNQENSQEILKQKSQSYKTTVSSFSYSLDMLMVAFDYEKVKEDECGKSVINLWKLYEKEKSSDDNNWYFTLARDYIAGWDTFFSCLKDSLSPNKKES